MSKVLTAKETLDYYTKQCKGTNRTAMIEFAKQHCKAQLKAILAKVKISDDKWDEIMNAYPENKIK